jgi:MFS transporter, FHS family, L-fucose permease
MMKNNNSYKLPLALVFSLFFLWAISSNLLPTMIRQLMKTCELNTFEASFTETAYWLAYFIFPIPIAMFMKRYSYKAGIIFGLVLAAAGGLLFFPAAMLKEYWAYLCIFFVIATGMCFLETAANPYVTALGDAATAPQRLNLAQSFNGLGAFIAAMFLSKLILSGTHYTRETLPADYPGGWEAYIQFETDAMKTPYLALAVLLLVIAGIFIFSRLPKIGDEGQRGTSKEKLIDFSVWKRSHLRWGVIAQFFYNGGQTAINSLFLVYCCSYAGISESEATTYFGLYMLAFLLGRWIGTGLMIRFRPQDMLLVYALVNILLCAIVRAALRGATVIAVDLDDEKLALARKVGAAYVINSRTENVHERMLEYSNGIGADVVIEAVGSPATYVMAVKQHRTKKMLFVFIYALIYG